MGVIYDEDPTQNKQAIIAVKEQQQAQQQQSQYNTSQGQIIAVVPGEQGRQDVVVYSIPEEDRFPGGPIIRVPDPQGHLDAFGKPVPGSTNVAPTAEEQKTITKYVQNSVVPSNIDKNDLTNPLSQEQFKPTGQKVKIDLPQGGFGPESPAMFANTRNYLLTLPNGTQVQVGESLNEDVYVYNGGLVGQLDDDPEWDYYTGYGGVTAGMAETARQAYIANKVDNQPDPQAQAYRADTTNLIKGGNGAASPITSEPVVSKDVFEQVFDFIYGGYKPQGGSAIVDWNQAVTSSMAARQMEAESIKQAIGGPAGSVAKGVYSLGASPLILTSALTGVPRAGEMLVTKGPGETAGVLGSNLKTNVDSMIEGAAEDPIATGVTLLPLGIGALKAGRVGAVKGFSKTIKESVPNEKANIAVDNTVPKSKPEVVIESSGKSFKESIETITKSEPPANEWERIADIGKPSNNVEIINREIKPVETKTKPFDPKKMVNDALNTEIIGPDNIFKKGVKVSKTEIKNVKQSAGEEFFDFKSDISKVKEYAGNTKQSQAIKSVGGDLYKSLGDYGYNRGIPRPTKRPARYIEVERDFTDKSNQMRRADNIWNFEETQQAQYKDVWNLDQLKGSETNVNIEGQSLKATDWEAVINTLNVRNAKANPSTYADWYARMFSKKPEYKIIFDDPKWGSSESRWGQSSKSFLKNDKGTVELLMQRPRPKSRSNNPIEEKTYNPVSRGEKIIAPRPKPPRSYRLTNTGLYGGAVAVNMLISPPVKSKKQRKDTWSKGIQAPKIGDITTPDFRFDTGLNYDPFQGQVMTPKPYIPPPNGNKQKQDIGMALALGAGAGLGVYSMSRMFKPAAIKGIGGDGWSNKRTFGAGMSKEKYFTGDITTLISGKKKRRVKRR